MRVVFDNRIVRFVVLFVLTTAAYAGTEFATGVLRKNFAPEQLPLVMIVFSIVASAALLFVYWRFVRWIEHRRVDELKASRAPANLIAGAALGIGLFAAVIAALSFTGTAHVGPFDAHQSLIRTGNMAVLSGIGEELIFRGVVFRIFEEMFGSLTALIVSAAFFGLTHLGNAHATLTSAAAIALEAGILLGVCYMAVRNLWLPMGLHFGWNFAEGGIFGTAVSGNAFKGLFTTTMSGPELLTGGAFGPEASVVAVAICGAAALAILALALRRGEWKPLRLAISDRASMPASAR